MSHDFDRRYWDDIWAGGDDAGDARVAGMAGSPPNPHLVRQIANLTPGTALEAGCGAGAEAIWLASQGWSVTAVDIAEVALARAADRAARAGADAVERLTWARADLSHWEPDTRYDLVTTHYAHPAMPQLDFYERIAGWVAPGGTLFIVGHLHHGHGHGHGNGHGAAHDHGHPPAEASATAAAISARLPARRWDIVTADEGTREMRGPGGTPTRVHDVVVRAVRRR